MPGYLESILDISESCDYFFALECCQRKVDSCWKGGAFLKMSPLAWERLFAFRATLVGRDFSNAHVKPSARQRGASVTRMEFDATPFAIRIGAVTIMTMISSKQSIVIIHCREEGCIGKYAPRGSRDLPKQNPCWGKSRGPRKAYFPIHPNSRQCIDILFYRKIHALGSVLENTRPRECIGNYTQIAG